MEKWAAVGFAALVQIIGLAVIWSRQSTELRDLRKLVEKHIARESGLHQTEEERDALERNIDLRFKGQSEAVAYQFEAIHVKLDRIIKMNSGNNNRPHGVGKRD